MSKRKHGKKKQISADEKERRRQLAEERKERQKLEKKHLIFNAIATTLGLIFYLLIFILLAIFNTRLLLIFLFLSLAILTLLLDQSGIRQLIFCWYPEKFPFADYLKKHDPERAVPMQLAGTISWYMSMLMILPVGFQRLWAMIWLVCIIIGLYYMLTTDEYSLEKGAKYECSALFLLIEPVFVSLATTRNVRITIPFIVFLVAFIIIYNIFYAIHINNGNQHYSRILYGIFVTAFCASSGFLLINTCLDFSEPKSHILEIEDKDYYAGKNSSYYIYIEDWNNSSELIDVEISSSEYKKLEIGDRVVIESRNGSLGAEYYSYKEKAPE